MARPAAWRPPSIFATCGRSVRRVGWRCGAARLPDPGLGEHAQAAMERRSASADGFRQPVAGCAGQHRLPTESPGVPGGVFAPCRGCGPFVPTLLEGAKAVQLAERAYRSNAESRRIDVEPCRTIDRLTANRELSASCRDPGEGPARPTRVGGTPGINLRLNLQNRRTP